MEKFLFAEPLKIDIKDYFDHDKKIYKTCPVFPFLNEAEIEKVIENYIDQDALKLEIEQVRESAAQENAIIEDTDFVIGLVDWNRFPELIKMLTIIREWAFRNEGGGVGGLDQDQYDLEPEMMQLMILNPNAQDVIGSIVGGYRYMMHHEDSYERGPMGDHFEFTDEFKKEFWIELGRSFINPYYKEREQKKSFDYVLHGLGYIYAKNKNAKGYFGKVTLYEIYELTEADHFFLAVAKNYWNESSIMKVMDSERIEESVLTDDDRSILDRDVFKGLFFQLRKRFQINIVPIMAVYNRMVDLDKMHYFGAFRHEAFGNSTEVGIAIEFDDIYDVIKEKFANQYV